jgi:hypothetical protein
VHWRQKRQFPPTLIPPAKSIETLAKLADDPTPLLNLVDEFGHSNGATH